MSVLKFKPEHKEQMFLLPPSVEEFVPENHLARLIDGIVNELDCSEIEEQYSELGQKSYSLQLLLNYGYTVTALEFIREERLNQNVKQIWHIFI